MKNDRYEDKDFVQVADGAGNVQPDKVPAKWVGTDLLPTGWKKATTVKTQQADLPAGPPAESETREVLEAYAVSAAGLTEEQAKGYSTKAELHAAIVAATSGS